MNNITPESLSVLVKESLRAEGFGPVGIAPAMPHPEDAARIAAWVASGMNGSMSYLGQNSDKRADISTLLPGARSVIVAALSYNNEDIPESDNRYFISRYARGKDYHIVIKEKLHRVLSVITSAIPDTRGRVFVDSAPLTEKSWAIHAGIGWRGRHSVIVNKEIGSFFFLGEIVTTAPLEYDEPFVQDHCGSCRCCIDACPTGAINSNRTINATKCISYCTIEKPAEEVDYPGNSIYGCDRCQEVCPWNKKAPHTGVSEFFATREIESLKCDDWESMSADRFDSIFAYSSIRRTGYEAMMRNVAMAKRNRSI
ncbi:MAG TPA: tRNA epoxyqueuosine(34) reductase QueG [Bacteroidales bacterium]|nr:tRNA epoxyqueuosine(34) reductase QueG [Bacteroidales bacterium]